MTIEMIMNCDCELKFLFSIILEFPARDKHFQIPEHFWMVSRTFLDGFQNNSVSTFQNNSGYGTILNGLQNNSISFLQSISSGLKMV